MIKILANAQFFGFAPSSLLLASLDTLSQQYPNTFAITIVTNPHIQALIAQRDTVDYQILDPGEAHLLPYLFEITAHARYDAFLSFYDPTLMVYAWFYDMPRILYDGLFHFWDEESFENDVRKDISQAVAYKQAQDTPGIIQWHDAIWGKNPHEMLFGGHFFADLQFTRKSPGIHERLDNYADLKEKIIPVDCIVHHAQASPLPFSQRDALVVSLGGSLNPIVTFEQNMFYAKTALSFYAEFIQTVPSAPRHCYFISHPKIHMALSQDHVQHKGIELISAVSQKQYFDILRKSIAALLPPSYTALQEAAYFKTPVLLLPEQNGGQPHCFELLKQSNYPLTYSMTVAGTLHTRYGEFEVERMYKAIQKLHDDRALHAMIHRNMVEFYECIHTADGNARMVTQQRKAIQSLLGGFDGAIQIAAHIYHYLNPQK